MVHETLRGEDQDDFRGITAGDLAVIADCLGGTLNLADGGTLFKYSRESRGRALARVLASLDRLPADAVMR